MLTSNGGIYPNKFIVAESDVLRSLMFGVQDGPRVNNIYFILVSLEIGWYIMMFIDNQGLGRWLE